MISALGVGSGLDLGTILTGLVEAEGSAKRALLDRQEADVQVRLSGYGAVTAAVDDFRASLASLKSLQPSAQFKASSSDSSVVQVSASALAQPTDLEVVVDQVASAHRLVSLAEASASVDLGGGTLTIENAAGETFSVSVLSELSSLNDLRDAINAADDNFGVQATVINTGSASHLVLEGQGVGSDHALQLTVTDDDANNTDLSGLSRLAFDASAPVGGGQNMTQARAAVDAQIVVNGVTMTNAAGNGFEDVVIGVDLTALAVSTDPVKVSVAAETATAQAISSALGDFVAAYNEFHSGLSSLTGYDADAGQAGSLIGDSTVRGLSGGLSAMLFRDFDGIASELNNLTKLGLTITSSGTLELDQATLDQALDAGGAEEVALLLGSDGEPFDQRAQLESVGFASPSSALGGGTLEIEYADETLSLTITAGVDDGLASIIDAINNAPTNPGVIAGYRLLDDGSYALTLSGSEPGAAIRVAVVDDDGNDSDSTGLSRLAFDPDAGVTQLAEVTPAQRETSVGFAAALDGLLERYSGADGLLQSKTDQLDIQLTDIADQRLALARYLTKFESNLQAQFSVLDSLVSELQSTQAFLTTQLSGLEALATRQAE